MQFALLFICIESFSAVVRRGYDLILMLSRVCLRALYGFLIYSFAMFRVFTNIMLKHVDSLLYAGSSCSFICDLICLTFHGHEILILLWCLGSYFFPCRYSLREPLALQFMPALSLGASNMIMFFSLALYWEHLAVVCCPSRGIARSYTPLDEYWGSLYYSFFHAIHCISQTRMFRKALYSHAQGHLSTRKRLILLRLID